MYVITADCVGCEQCMEDCPAEAISVQGGRAVIDNLSCIECGLCAEQCPMYAVELGGI